MRIILNMVLCLSLLFVSCSDNTGGKQETKDCTSHTDEIALIVKNIKPVIISEYNTRSNLGFCFLNESTLDDRMVRVSGEAYREEWQPVEGKVLSETVTFAKVHLLAVWTNSAWKVEKMSNVYEATAFVGVSASCSLPYAYVVRIVEVSNNRYRVESPIVVPLYDTYW